MSKKIESFSDPALAASYASLKAGRGLQPRVEYSNEESNWAIVVNEENDPWYFWVEAKNGVVSAADLKEVALESKRLFKEHQLRVRVLSNDRRRADIEALIAIGAEPNFSTGRRGGQTGIINIGHYKFVVGTREFLGERHIAIDQISSNRKDDTQEDVVAGILDVFREHFERSKQKMTR